ncbi:alpha/beta hydrolase [Nocardioides sp. Root151]|uniref:alpha/beta hydrolase n=1 Tax=Nocardioides sp. Root151 TaxID=1736475 RepID=UPI000702D1A5|nr:dipeptidyl aminopeptidase [Nocardioides sp. Root151]KQZ66796.1 dipeptidyl aminopeptidase [Nocardioides sp. Root151]
MSLGSVEIPPADALWRAMSVTRLLDYGMQYADVLALEQRTGLGQPWDDAAEELAEAHLARAGSAESEDRIATALDGYRAAMVCFLTAQMAHNFDNQRKRGLYRRLTSAAERAGHLRAPRWERIALPFEGGRLFGWLVPPVTPVLGTVVLFGGQSGWGTAYLRQAEALNRRGIAALLAEGPGQGETRLEGGLLLDVDVRAAYSRFVDSVASRPELGPGIGLWGNSLGGLFAATTAASDSRVTAVCVNGAPARPRLLGFRTFEDQAAAMLGTRDQATIERNFERIALQPTDRISGALLVLHGGADPITSLPDQQPFLDSGTADTLLKVWEDGEHTIYNHSEERSAYVADWFVGRFAELER